MPTHQIHPDALEQTLLELERLGEDVVTTRETGDYVEVVTRTSDRTETR